VLALRAKNGPFLWQLPPTLGYDEARLAAFFDLLPRTAGEAAEIAQRHDDKVPDDRALTGTDTPDRPLRHALEVRHASFTRAETAALLEKHDIATVVADTAGKWPLPAATRRRRWTGGPSAASGGSARAGTSTSTSTTTRRASRRTTRWR
jgi:uncharacterized protein YecE (DUF72 family)